MDIKDKLKNWMDPRWDYEIKCDVFEPLSLDELQKIAKLYDIKETSRIKICNKLVEILERKKKEYEDTLGVDAGACLNSTDPISSLDIIDIDTRSLITIKQDEHVYCFEIEGLYTNVVVNKNKKNPYTNVEFNDDIVEFIKNEYKKYTTLRGKKFDIDAYSSETNLKALVTQLSNYLPYVTGIEKFMVVDRNTINKFIYELSIAGLDTKVDLLNESVKIKPKDDTKLIQEKISIVQRLIRLIVQDSSRIHMITDIWYELFQEKKVKTFTDLLYDNIFGII